MNLNIPENEKTPLVKQLLEIINELSQENIFLKKEILELKKETIRPKIKPSKLNAPEREDTEEDGRKAKQKSRKGIKKNKKNIDIYEEIVVEPDNIPEGAVFCKIL